MKMMDMIFGWCHSWKFTAFVCLLLQFISISCSTEKHCGESRFDYRDYIRIVGGRNSGPGEWPWQASLHQKDMLSGKRLGQHCGGTLIREDWILTAAHCIVDPLFNFALPPPFWHVRLGHVNVAKKGVNERVYAVSKIIIHKHFDPKTWHNDIALVKLRTPVDINNDDDFVNTICLPRENDTFEGRYCAVTGWGKLKEYGNSADILQKIRVPVLSGEECRKAYKNVNFVTEGMICAGWKEGGRGPCVGDSGGPLQCKMGDGRWVQAGITSWGVGCAEPDYPGVYVRVREYMKWMNEQMDKHETLNDPETSTT